MSDHPQEPDAPHDESVPAPEPAPPPAHPAGMRLRPQRPPVTRLSRSVLIGLGTVACGGIFAALAIALLPHHQEASTQPVATSAKTLPEALASIPKNYTEAAQEAPKLGPPLPGDLGKPMLKAGVTPPAMAPAPTPEQQRIAQERDAARTSHLFAVTNSASAAQPSASAPAAETSPQVNQVSTDPTDTENMQAQKIAFAPSGSQ